MSKLSDKYIAGFLDADGSIGVAWGSAKVPRYTGRLVIGWSQKSSNDEVLNQIQEAIGGTIDQVEVKGTKYSRLTLTCGTAEKVLNRIAKYLVIKRHYAHACLQVVGNKVADVEETKAWLKEQRRVKSLPVPKFPSRRWLAGYFDGDGCLSSTLQGRYKYATLRLNIAAAEYDTEGIETICKNFGGSITDMCGGRVKQYNVCLNPSKAIKMLSYFAKHLIVKKDQAYFILGCAKMGHYRDGKNIKMALKRLKNTYLHRLNEPKQEVTELLKTVEDRQKPWNKTGALVCTDCGTSKHRHMGNGLCSACYQKQRRVHVKLQSEMAA